MSKPHFDASRFAKALAFFEDIRGSSVLFLPCSLYNWTLPEGARLFHGMPLDVKENIRRRVCIIYDPSRSDQGVLALKALKLSDSFMELYCNNNFIGEE
ncbi:hypothetical protein JHK82_044942 [Glycine max]|nr:hypothetical protein JHK82_044942 [Glycine max]